MKLVSAQKKIIQFFSSRIQNMEAYKRARRRKIGIRIILEVINFNTVLRKEFRENLLNSVKFSPNL